jgi:hypothetical protein
MNENDKLEDCNFDAFEFKDIEDLLEAKRVTY